MQIPYNVNWFFLELKAITLNMILRNYNDNGEMLISEFRPEVEWTYRDLEGNANWSINEDINDTTNKVINEINEMNKANEIVNEDKKFPNQQEL